MSLFLLQLDVLKQVDIHGRSPFSEEKEEREREHGERGGKVGRKEGRGISDQDVR